MKRCDLHVSRPRNSAIWQLNRLKRDRRKRTEACKELARLYHQFGQTKAALTTLDEWFTQRTV